MKFSNTWSLSVNIIEFFCFSTLLAFIAVFFVHQEYDFTRGITRDREMLVLQLIS